MSWLQNRLRELRVSRINEVFRPLSPVQVMELESLIGCDLPNDYRDFVTTCGGCAFPHGFVVEEEPGNDFHIDKLFGAPASGRVDDVFRALRDFDDMPTGYLTIGNNFVGNTVVLDARSGRIFRRSFYSGDGSLVEIAASFRDLLDRAHLEDEG